MSFGKKPQISWDDGRVPDNAASTESLDALLQQFEVVQAPSAAELESLPRQNPLSPLASLFQRSPFRATQGRPPRPQGVSTSHWHDRGSPRHPPSVDGGHVARRTQDSSSLADMASPSRALHGGGQRYVGATVNLTEESPALASPPLHLQDDRRHAPVRGGDIAMEQSLSLESLETLGSSSVSSPRGGGGQATLRWGQGVRHHPLGEALPTMYRPPSAASLVSATSTAQPPLLLMATAGSEPPPPVPHASEAHESAGQGPDLAARAVQGGPDTPRWTPWEARVEASPGRAEEAAMPAAPPSPFAAAAQLPAPLSIASRSDFSTASSATTPSSHSEYDSPAWGQQHPDGPRGFQRMGDQGGWRHGQPFGGPPPLLPHLDGGHTPSMPGRSQLRKRDFESELLERLLSHGNRGAYAGHLSGHFVRPAVIPEARGGGWRALSLPKMAFVTIIFLCLALFLLIFSAGRMHAQKATWLHSSASVVDIAAGPISALTLAQASAEEPEGASTDGIQASARHRPSLSHQGTREPVPENGTEGEKQHERRPGSVLIANQVPDSRKRSAVGIKVVQPKLA